MQANSQISVDKEKEENTLLKLFNDWSEKNSSQLRGIQKLSLKNMNRLIFQRDPIW